MFGDFMLLEAASGGARRAARLALGDTGGRDEAWLRDTLFAHPEILPIRDLDPAFGPLIPLCTELRTDAGPLDIAFINTDGRLTLVECKLWRNAEARRKVVAQVIDYARAISRWSYSDLRRQVSMATGRKGDVPFDLAKAVDPNLEEHRFADAVTRGMRSGRFLLLIAGDGIREDIGAMADLVNRNAASAFELGLVEVALYDLAGEGLAIQPRVLAKTHVLERTVVLLSDAEGRALGDEVVVESIAPAGPVREPGVESPKQAEYRAWWSPVMAMAFDDPDQEPPALRWPNNVRVSLPAQGVWLTAYRSGEPGERLGVFLTGKEHDVAGLWARIRADVLQNLDALPDGVQVDDPASRSPLRIERAGADFPSEEAKRAWFSATLNQFVNVLRPAIKRAGEALAS